MPDPSARPSADPSSVRPDGPRPAAAHPAPDVVVIGAGVIGAAIAHFATERGLRVTVVERGSAASGTSSHGEGNVLVSDKEPSAELDLALYSNRVWKEDLGEHGPEWEFDPKGGLVVARSDSSMEALARLSVGQRSGGIDVELVDRAGVLALEPHANPALVGGAYYPEDAQVQPILVTRRLLALAASRGAQVLTDTEVIGLLTSGGTVRGVRTSRGDIPAGVVINATGPWGARIAQMAGVSIPVEPRRGFVLVTEPVPVLVRHKVYAAEYVGDVGSSDATLQSSPVVEGTRAGTILIGSTRERVGFDPVMSVPAVRTLAARALELFPVLAGVRALRTYWGFRPYCADHLPVIGPDPRAPGLWHACGHEGAGIGLSAGTGKLVAQALAGEPTDLDLAPFSAGRFGETTDHESAEEVA